MLPPGEWDPQIRIEPPDNPPSPTTRVATVANVGGESPKTPRANSMAVKKQVEELINFQCEKRYIKLWLIQHVMNYVIHSLDPSLDWFMMAGVGGPVSLATFVMLFTGTVWQPFYCCSLLP